jgi:O-methyltransferase involved in polyketide biosynthesis
MREIAQDSAIVFTYVDKAVIDSDNNFEGAARLKQVLARAGERWTFGFDPPELKAYLAERGYRFAREYRIRRTPFSLFQASRMKLAWL